MRLPLEASSQVFFTTSLSIWPQVSLSCQGGGTDPNKKSTGLGGEPRLVPTETWKDQPRPGVREWGTVQGSASARHGAMQML